VKVHYFVIVTILSLVTLRGYYYYYLFRIKVQHKKTHIIQIQHTSKTNKKGEMHIHTSVRWIVLRRTVQHSLL